MFHLQNVRETDSGAIYVAALDIQQTEVTGEDDKLCRWIQFTAQGTSSKY